MVLKGWAPSQVATRVCLWEILSSDSYGLQLLFLELVKQFDIISGIYNLKEYCGCEYRYIFW